MISLVQLWLPILLSAVFVFVASSLLNMVLRFWHASDYRGFSNEDEVAAAIRNGGSAPGMYMLPFCTPDAMKKSETQEKFKRGPVGMLALRRPGAMNMAAQLGQWFGFCVLTALFCALLSVHALPAGAQFAYVFHLIGLAALLGYAFCSIPNAIWWGHPWGVAVKHFIDGVIYALITGATFAWLWPAA